MQPMKRWEEASAFVSRNHVKRAKDVIVAALDVIVTGDAALVWDALQLSMPVDKELGSKECQSQIPRSSDRNIPKIYHLRNTRHYLSYDDRKSIVQAVVMSCTDYCNSFLVGVPAV